MNVLLQANAALLGIALICFETCVASAAPRTKAFSITGFGSYQTYDMKDVNQAMQGALASYSGARADKDEINSGAGFGTGIRIWPSEKVFVSLEFQRLSASNSGSGQFAGSTYTVDLAVPASSLAMSVGFMLTHGSLVRAGLAAGGGYYLTTGELVTRGPGGSTSNLEGSGFGVHGLGLVLVRVTRRLDFEVDAGYRHARTTDVTSNGSRYRNADGSLTKIDWSGFVSRAGLTFWVAGK